MRALRLAQAAAEAEGLRLRRRARRAVTYAILLIVALGFLAFAVVLGHAAIWLFLAPSYGAPATTLGLAAGDLLIAVVLALAAARSRPGPAEVDARLIRDQAWQGVQQSINVWGGLAALVQILAAWRSGRGGTK